jgi:hypothetical protein
MPFKSKAQQRKLEALAAEGKFGKGNIEEWESSTDFKHLPEHVKKAKAWGKAANKVSAEKRRRKIRKRHRDMPEYLEPAEKAGRNTR